MNLRDERVVVTGGSGFLGSFVCEQLHRKGVEKIYVPRSDNYDLTEEDGVQAMYEDFSPTVVFHLAAVVGGIGTNRRKPGKIYYENIRMGTNIIEEARRFGLKKLITIGSSCAYPENLEIPFEEEQLWAGYPEQTNAPYGLAKKMMLVQGEAYQRQYDSPPMIHLIPANLYGPRDNFDYHESHVIPAMIRKLYEARNEEDSEVEFWGTGTPTRDFLYVREAAEAIIQAAVKYDSLKPINIASERELRIRRLAQILKSVIGYTGEITWDDSRPDGRERVCLDTTRAKELIGFESELSNREGLKRTVRWFEENRDSVLETPNTTGFRRTLPDYVITKP